MPLNLQAPVAAPPARPLQPEDEAEAVADVGDADRSSILIVDDLPEKHLVFRAVLEELGQELVFVRSGSEALREVLRREFAVILLDVNMPDMDGFETARLIRRYRRAAHTPIIFVTAYVDEVQTHRGYELGAVDYIMSPVVPQVLRSKVQVFVDLHTMQRRVRQQAEQRVALAAAEAARHVAEQSTQRSNLLSQVSRVLGATLDAEVAKRALLELLVPALGPCAALVLHTPPQPPGPLLLCRIGPGAGPTGFSQHDLERLPPGAQAAFFDALSSGQPQALEAQMPWADIDGTLPAGTVLPLVHGPRVLGALFIAAPQDRELTEALAERAALAFENARLYRTLQAEIEERRRAEERLQAINQRKDEFLAMLSHELRNPLAPIRSALELIRRIAPAEPKLSWATDVCDRQVRHLTELVEELLDVARIGQGKISLQLQPLDLLSVVAQGVETIRPELDARGHRLQLHLPGRPVWMRGDFARMSQVLANLLNNAAKYTPEGGLIQVSLLVVEGQAVLSVRDNGVGMEPALLPTVFELFEQGERSLDRSQGGLGVGLTLVQRLVQLHHGTVEARSEGPGHGSEFIVRLPCLTDADAPVQAPAAPEERLSDETCRVLVVDDNRDAADTVAMFLRIEGHSVETAHDGLEAVERAQAFAPDVVVLDIGLPGLDGFEVASRLRELPATRQALVIALTGYGQKADQEQARHAGFDHHLVKPTDVKALVTLIGRWLHERARAAESGGGRAGR